MKWIWCFINDIMWSGPNSKIPWVYNDFAHTSTLTGTFGRMCMLHFFVQSKSNWWCYADVVSWNSLHLEFKYNVNNGIFILVHAYISSYELPAECVLGLFFSWDPWVGGGGWGGLWGFLWWAPSANRKDHHGVSSGWSSVWHRSNTGLSSTQYEQIPIILGVWPFWLTLFFFRLITFWRAYG